MQRIPLEQAKPGMIIAQKLVREDGVLLCQKGAELTDAMIRLLQRMNFETVPVEGQAIESPDEREARIAKEEAAIEVRFSRVASDPVLAKLKQTLLARLREENG